MEYKIENINNKKNIFYHEIPKEKSKKRSTLGKLLLKELLENHNMSYDDIDYEINEYGKPYLKNNSYFFNISHSYDYVITVISKKEIGVDIEKIRKVPFNTMNYFATSKEKEYILSTNDNIEERLFQIYTLKESYFKMLGTNLDHILEVEFIVKDNTISCSDKNVTVGFINDIEGYIISYCEKNR